MRQRLEPLLLVLCLVGCASTPTSTVDAFAQRSANNSFEVFDRSFRSPSALVLPVVHDRQTSPMACGASALASVINYWEGPGTVSSGEIWTQTPPADSARGYTLAEIMTRAHEHGLLASGVRLTDSDIVRELENGRPVLVPVRMPSIYVQSRSVPGTDTPVVGVAAGFFEQRIGYISEFTGMAMVDHYLLVVGYDRRDFAVIEPVMGFRIISFQRLQRYRRAFNNAAVVFSGRPGQAPAQASGAAAAAPAQSYVQG